MLSTRPIYSFTLGFQTLEITICRSLFNRIEHLSLHLVPASVFMFRDKTQHSLSLNNALLCTSKCSYGGNYVCQLSLLKNPLRL